MAIHTVGLLADTPSFNDLTADLKKKPSKPAAVACGGNGAEGENPKAPAESDRLSASEKTKYGTESKSYMVELSGATSGYTTGGGGLSSNEKAPHQPRQGYLHKLKSVRKRLDSQPELYSNYHINYNLPSVEEYEKLGTTMSSVVKPFYASPDPGGGDLVFMDDDY